MSHYSSSLTPIRPRTISSLIQEIMGETVGVQKFAHILNLDIEDVVAMKNKHQLIAYLDTYHRWRFPLKQLDSENRILDGIPQILTMLEEAGWKEGYSQYWFFLLSRRYGLNRTIFQLLLEDRKNEAYSVTRQWLLEQSLVDTGEVLP